MCMYVHMLLYLVSVICKYTYNHSQDLENTDWGDVFSPPEIFSQGLNSDLRNLWHKFKMRSHRFCSLF